jgi:hypothetical protein
VRLVVNKDKSACVNFVKILTGLMLYGERPFEFTRHYWEDGRDDRNDDGNGAGGGGD